VGLVVLEVAAVRLACWLLRHDHCLSARLVMVGSYELPAGR
jgi:hypothetical protein